MTESTNHAHSESISEQGGKKQKLDYEMLKKACSQGGASVLTITTELKPAAGEHGGIAPARYTLSKKTQGKKPQSVYAFETRYVGGEVKKVVIIDGKASQLNRVEDAIRLAIQEGGKDEPLKGMPSIRVSYGSEKRFDYELPHRFVDGHIRFATIDKEPDDKESDGKESINSNAAYSTARDATPANVMPLMELSPLSLVLGSWDSTRKSGQARFRSCLVGEIIGVLADQSPNGTLIPARGAGRYDEVAPGVYLTKEEIKALIERQSGWLDVEKYKKKIKDAKKDEEGRPSAAFLGLGSIPPSLDTLGMVACTRIIRSNVFSFSALRQLRFGKNNEGNIVCRAVLAALALHGLSLSYQELNLRANCDLVEAEKPIFMLDQRYGESKVIAGLEPGDTKTLLQEAIKEAKDKADLKWDGTVLEVKGDESIFKGFSADSDEE